MMDTRSQSRLTGLNSPVRPMAVGAVQHWMGDAGMFVYDFEVLKGDTVVASKRSIALPDVSAAWPKIANLAETIEEPGYKIRVRDQAGGIVILIGVAALRICVPGKTTSGRSIQARQSSSRSREYLFSNDNWRAAIRKAMRRMFHVKRSLCTWIFIAIRVKSARFRAPIRSITHDR